MKGKPRRIEFRDVQLPLSGPREPLSRLVLDYVSLLKDEDRLFPFSLVKNERGQIIGCKRACQQRLEQAYRREGRRGKEAAMNGDVVLRSEVSTGLTNIRFQMFRDYKRAFDEMNRKLEEVKSSDIGAREYLKSLGNELMSQIENAKWYNTTESKSILSGESPKIDGKESLRRGLEIQEIY